jgi:hypothetical protein
MEGSPNDSMKQEPGRLTHLNPEAESVRDDAHVSNENEEEDEKDLSPQALRRWTVY